MTTRKSYDTKIKYLARQGLLPENYRKQINRSLICKWKQEPVEKYVGYELNSNIEELYELMKVVSEDQKLQKVVRSVYRIQKTLRDIIGKGAEYIKTVKKFKTEVVQVIQQAGKVISIPKASKLMGISRSTFRIWSMEVYYKCNNSLLKLCNNTYPQQLTIKEIKKMHKLLLDKRFIYWPIKSVAFYSIKKNIIKVHPNTWYKYSRLMKIERMLFRKKKRIYPEGIRASQPNEKWHADITELRLANGQLAYIYLVIDNFSRYIISWQVADKICAKIRLDTFKEAVQKTQIKKQIDFSTQLIVDGGTENNNKSVNAYVETLPDKLSKVIALKDILKSNAMVEYTNKVLKYEYLYVQTILNIEHLFKVMHKSVYNFNCIRPHGALSGLTPLESYRGMAVNLLREKSIMREALIERVNWNKTNNCLGCPFGCRK